MATDYEVIVYGAVCLDEIWRVEKLAPPGGYVETLEDRKMVGGEATNTAIALTRWGVQVALLGNELGEDADGELLRALFARDVPELDIRFLVTSVEANTPYCLCIATPDGHRTMYGRGFSAMRSTPLSPELARAARLFTMEPNAFEAGLEACRVAARAGIGIVPMDYSRVPEVNRVASLVVTSTDHIGLRPEPELLTYAADLRDTYGPTAIITRGDRGCIVAERGGKPGAAFRIPAYVAPAVVDSTGAGDIFRAGLLYGERNGWDIERAVRFASAAAALNCGAMGGWGGVRSVEEIEAFQQTAPIHSI